MRSQGMKRPNRSSGWKLIAAGLLFVLLPALGLWLSYPYQFTYPQESGRPPTQDFVLGHGIHRQVVYAVMILAGVVMIAMGVREWKRSGE